MQYTDRPFLENLDSEDQSCGSKTPGSQDAGGELPDCQLPDCQYTDGKVPRGHELPLVYQSWLPKAAGQPQAIVAIVHGLGGHSGLWQNVAKALVPQGIGVYAVDLRGHGRSPGKRGYINAWSEFRTDVAAFLSLIQQQSQQQSQQQASQPQVSQPQAGPPIFLWGHSLGGAIALDYGLRFSPGETPPIPQGLRGVIATAPALGTTGVSPLRLAAGKLLSRFWPGFTLPSGMPDEIGSRDSAVNQAYATDPLRHDLGSARLATEFFATVDYLHTHASDWQLPLLVLHGTADQVTSPSCSRGWFDQIPWIDKQYIAYPGAYHELHEDLDRVQMLQDITAWIQAHLRA